MAGTVRPGDAGAVQDEGDTESVQADIHQNLIEGTVEEGCVDRYHRVQVSGGHASGCGHRVLLGDPDVEDSIGNSLAKRPNPVGAASPR